MHLSLNYQIIFNAAGNSMAFAKYATGEILEVNTAWIRSMGIGREQAVGRTGEELGLWTNPAERDACLDALEKNGHFSNLEAKIGINSGEVPCLLSGNLIEMEGQHYVLWEFRDISEQKRAEELLIHREEQIKAFLFASEQSRRLLLSILQDEKRAKMALQESESRFRELFEHTGSGVAVYQARDDGQDFVFIDLNLAGERSTRVVREDILGRSVQEVFPGVRAMGVFALLQRVWRTGVPESLPVTLYQDERIEEWFENYVYRLPSGEVVAVYDNISDQVRMEQENHRNAERLSSLVRVLQYSAPTIQDFLDFALDEAIRLTGSKVGYIYLYEKEEQKLVLNSWSKDVKTQGAIIGPLSCYRLDQTGMWGEAVRQRQPILRNDYRASPPLEKGFPKEHADLHRFLTLPVLNGDHVVAVVGIGNKENDYDRLDVLQLTVLMDGVWKVVEQKQAEESRRTSELRYRRLFESAKEGILILDADSGLIVDANPFVENLLGHAPSKLLGKTFWEIDSFQEIASSRETFAALQQKEYTLFEDLPLKRKDGSSLSVEFISNVYLVENENVIQCNIRDISERKQLEKQLIQSQKMESVGRLAGGVAHDFNNMLAVILGHIELALESLDPGNPLCTDLEEIRKAAERSANLTGQLLAFARKQTVAPKVLDLNETMEGMLQMLGRLIGEDIDLAWHPGENLWPVKIDPSQVDQILANLCVNARDAIAGVGKVTIETGSATLDRSYCINHAGFSPGEYALLAVSDNGCGMNREILDRLFEPFFTTKEKGRGTGLGLATVYGIVKQNKGFIHVYSELNQGTTFKIYLPRYKGKAEQIQPERGAEPAGQNQGTILLVEDEPAILQLAGRMLRSLGYTVLAAGTPGEAIRLAQEYPGEIDLIVTDVVMPEMTGRDLARNLLHLYPNVKHLFMSGYTADVIVHHGVLDEGVHFIQKPFSFRDLASKVRSALGIGNRNPDKTEASHRLQQ